jgi:hypothetical protein
MAPVSNAFARWLVAEQDVHDATHLMLYHLRAGEAHEAKAQQAVVSQLRHDAGVLLRDYLHVMQIEGGELWFYRLPVLEVCDPA